jgi:hypothetical protein
VHGALRRGLSVSASLRHDNPGWPEQALLYHKTCIDNPNYGIGREFARALCGLGFVQMWIKWFA